MRKMRSIPARVLTPRVDFFSLIFRILLIGKKRLLVGTSKMPKMCRYATANSGPGSSCAGVGPAW